MITSRSDALVVFGATGDLAYKQIFPALQALVRRRHLDMPVIGVAHVHDPETLATYPPADITIEHIGDLLRYDLPALLPAHQAGSTNAASSCGSIPGKT